MTERSLDEMGFAEVIQQDPTFESNCERRGHINKLRGYLARVALLDYVPEDCLNYRMSLPGNPHITGHSKTAL